MDQAMRVPRGILNAHHQVKEVNLERKHYTNYDILEDTNFYRQKQRSVASKNYLR